MRTHRQRGGGIRSLGAAAIVGLAVGLVAPGCSSSSNNDTGGADAGPTDNGIHPDATTGNPDAMGGDATPGDGANPDAAPPTCNPTGMGNPNQAATAVARSSSTAASAFWSPFNSVPSPDGTTIYFVADSPAGIGVFSVAAMNGTTAALKVGDPFETPIDIQVSSDGNTLYIVDIGAEAEMNTKQGRIFSMSNAGGSASAIAAADGLRPRGLDIVKSASTDVIYFTGSTATGTASIFKMNADGSMMTTVAQGGAFTELSGIAVTKTGDVYAADGSGTIFKVSGGNTTPFVSGLSLAFPAGIALSADESALLVSQLDDATHTSMIGRYPLGGGNKSTFNMGINMTNEPAGLHRARCVDTYTWANASGCADCASGQGGIYIVKGSQ